MASIEKREKRRANRTRKNQQAELIAKEDADEIPLEDDEPIEEVDGVEVAKQLKKDYDSPYMPVPGPTSYEELDAMKEAQEKASQIRAETWNVQDLVSNIAYSAMSPEDKSKAIVNVGKGFGTRLKSIANDKMEKEVDMELLQLQAILAIDSRHTSVIEKASDFITKNFGNPKEGSKTRARLLIKEVIESIESGAYPEEARTRVPVVLKTAKDAGIGSSRTVMIEKDASGSWRAVLYPTNNFKDRDGEIIAKAAHEEYVDWVNKNMECAPVFATWHTPGTARQNPMDFVGYDHGIMITSLPLTDNEAASLLKMQTQMDIGLSIGGIALERDGNIITKYRMFEVSDLPLERAANPFTDIDLVSKEAQMQPKAMKEYLAGMIGDERADEVLGKMALTQKQLQDSGVEEKEVKTTTEPAAPTPPTAPQINLNELVEKLSKEFGMEELSTTISQLQASAEKVPVLEELVKQLATNRDDELAKMIEPPATKSLAWMKSRPSQKDETVLKEGDDGDEKLKKSAPETSWLSEALQVPSMK